MDLYLYLTFAAWWWNCSRVGVAWHMGKSHSGQVAVVTTALDAQNWTALLTTKIFTLQSQHTNDLHFKCICSWLDNASKTCRRLPSWIRCTLRISEQCQCDRHSPYTILTHYLQQQHNQFCEPFTGQHQLIPNNKLIHTNMNCHSSHL